MRFKNNNNKKNNNVYIHCKYFFASFCMDKNIHIVKKISILIASHKLPVAVFICTEVTYDVLVIRLNSISDLVTLKEKQTILHYTFCNIID